MTAQLGWGIIGIGNIVRSTIAPVMVAEDSCALVAATSRDRGRAEAFAAQFHVDHAYDDYDAMLANPAVQAVFIATPNAQHPDQVIAAANAGKHVLCDKPMALNAADARRALAACAAGEVYLGVNFHNRYLPWVRDVARLIGEGAIGEVTLVDVEVASGARNYDNWRADPELAGLGSVFNVGTHALDFLRVILGAEPVEVTAMFDAPADGVEMLALALIRFESGALVQVNMNERVPFPNNRITVHGTRGRIHGTDLTRSRISGDLTVTTPAGSETRHYPAPEAHRMAVAGFAEAVLEDRQPVPSGHDGLRSAQLCDAIAASVRERRTVEVER
jgi:1,5-anhydro-D-fructose reductase (1,5-anhydro-D-mannitol-forming)